MAYQQADHRRPAHGGGGFSGMPSGQDLIAATIFLSFLLHIAAFGGLYAYSQFSHRPMQATNREEPYIVHLIDQGPEPGTEGAGKSSIVNAAPAPAAPAVKKAEPVEKKLLPIKKEAAAEIKKVAVVKKTVVEKKGAIEEKPLVSKQKTKPVGETSKQADAVAKEVREKKGGGSIDIRKFPYEWYLRIMETRIFSNWDTLKLNYYTDRTLKVTIFFQIDKTGNIAKIKVEQSTMNDNIDASAMEAVKKSAPFPPLPPGYVDETLDVHFGFTLTPTP